MTTASGATRPPTRPAIAPRDSAELAAIVRGARRDGEALRIAGAGRWSGAGSPAGRIEVGAREVSLAAMTGIVAYVPADLTLTVRAGTTLAELDAATAPNNQWCPLIPWGDDHGTVGATFATATTGPCAGALGKPRDIALGVEFVDGTGVIARGGGRVVKNVAGFDLTRLMVGAFGSFGAITELTVRLRARPQVDATWLVRIPDAGVDAAAQISSLRRGVITPIACELLAEGPARALGVTSGTVLVRYAGNATLVAAARTAVARVGLVSDADPELWTRFRALDPHPRRLADAPLAHPVAARIKERFDPERILNRGVLGETA